MELMPVPMTVIVTPLSAAPLEAAVNALVAPPWMLPVIVAEPEPGVPGTAPLAPFAGDVGDPLPPHAAATARIAEINDSRKPLRMSPPFGRRATGVPVSP
jgi:hypothetical protein